MPATKDRTGKIDWTIPTGRSPGSKNWDGNKRRKEWWELKARELGIAIHGKWISKAAKTLHPWGWKPCQTCGRWMRLSYSYPRAVTVSALNAHLPPDAQLDPLTLLDVYETLDHFVDTIGQEASARIFASVFPELGPTEGADADELKARVEEKLVRTESRRFSPGVMSNAPDRLDGFHTYNLCCRSGQDTGRSRENLRTYGVDRRAFEHWSEGDWVAADLLMHSTSRGSCPRCEEIRDLTADHVGPISLGFRHMPYFEAVCGSCNSAKNNRMSFDDVDALRRLDSEVDRVVSWHAASLWKRSKDRVDDRESALRLSKLLNVNQHEFLRLLLRARAAGVPDALMQFLSPGYSENRAEFVGLNPETLRYERIERTRRQPTYALSKATRLVRIAFEALDDYALKEKRNVQAVPGDLLVEVSAGVDEALQRAVADPSLWREPLLEALDPAEPANRRENRIQELIGPGHYDPDHDYGYVRQAFERYMDRVGEVLAARLDDEDAIKLWDRALGEAEP